MTTVGRPKHIPIRSCIVCRQASDKRTLLRVVRQPEKSGGSVIVDRSGKAPGRGAYVCASDKCIALAQKQKRFERALAITTDAISNEVFVRLSAMAEEAAALRPQLAVETKSDG